MEAEKLVRRTRADLEKNLADLYSSKRDRTQLLASALAKIYPAGATG